MNIAVFGLGYVGCVSIGCLAQNGHQIIGVDISDEKVDLINKGIPTIIEKDIDIIIKQQWSDGKIKATKNYLNAVLETDLAFICVGTPSMQTGQLNLEYVYETARQIGESLRQKETFYVVAIRSTVLPGTNQKIGEIIGKASGKLRNEGFAVVSNPEFLREGTAVADYYTPAVTVLGSDNPEALRQMESIYEKVNAPIVKTEIQVAEIIKYVNNSFHALKISFANEVGTICKSLNIDSYSVMDLLVKDNRLNISPAYLKPGMAFGGSCLPKDLKGLCTIAHDYYLNTPLLKSIDESNAIHANRAFELIEKFRSKKVGIVGLAFKNGTDDLRFSPAVELVEKLIGKGYDVKIYDKNVVVSKLMGANKCYIEEKLPHISGMLDFTLEEIIQHSQTIVLVHRLEEIIEQQKIIKFKNIVDLKGYMEFIGFKNYSGIAW